MYTEYELEELEKGLFEEKERTRKELEELEKEIARTGVGPEDDDYIREELDSVYIHPDNDTTSLASDHNREPTTVS